MFLAPKSSHTILNHTLGQDYCQAAFFQDKAHVMAGSLCFVLQEFSLKMCKDRSGGITQQRVTLRGKSERCFRV